jgi:hypothetical protein
LLATYFFILTIYLIIYNTGGGQHDRRANASSIAKFANLSACLLNSLEMYVKEQSNLLFFNIFFASR